MLPRRLLPRSLIRGLSLPAKRSSGAGPLPASMAAAQASHRVLCLGDSLTEGWVNLSRKFYPYADQLRALAKAHNVVSFEVVEEGVSGELVAPTMVERTLQVLGAANAAGKDYTHIVIEGGFNDIGYGRTGDEIFGGLLRIYQAGARTGAHVVALTLYEYDADVARSPVLRGCDAARRRLNQLIREHAQASREQGKLTLVDLDKHITRETKPPSGKGDSLYSDDLHLTAEGYQVMGQLVWEQVLAPELGLTGAARADGSTAPGGGG